MINANLLQVIIFEGLFQQRQANLKFLTPPLTIYH